MAVSNLSGGLMIGRFLVFIGVLALVGVWSSTKLWSSTKQALAATVVSDADVSVEYQIWEKGRPDKGLSTAIINASIVNNERAVVRNIVVSCAFFNANDAEIESATRTLSEAVAARSRKLIAGVNFGFVKQNAATVSCHVKGVERIADPQWAAAQWAAARGIQEEAITLPAGFSQSWTAPQPFKDVVVRGDLVADVVRAAFLCGRHCGVEDGPYVVVINAKPKASGVRDFLFRDEKGRGIAKLTVTVRGIAEPSEPAATSESAAAPAITSWTYEQLARKPEAYVGRTLTFRGKVVQAVQEGKVTTLRIATSADVRDIMYVEYRGSPSEPRILEGDTADVRGKFVGVKSYKAVAGNIIQIPHVIACDVSPTPKSTIQVLQAPQQPIPCDPRE